MEACSYGCPCNILPGIVFCLLVWLDPQQHPNMCVPPLWGGIYPWTNTIVTPRRRQQHLPSPTCNFILRAVIFYCLFVAFQHFVCIPLFLALPLFGGICCCLHFCSSSSDLPSCLFSTIPARVHYMCGLFCLFILHLWDTVLFSARTGMGSAVNILRWALPNRVVLWHCVQLTPSCCVCLYAAAPPYKLLPPSRPQALSCGNGTGMVVWRYSS